LRRDDNLPLHRVIPDQLRRERDTPTPRFNLKVGDDRYDRYGNLIFYVKRDLFDFFIVDRHMVWQEPQLAGNDAMINSGRYRLLEKCHQVVLAYTEAPQVLRAPPGFRLPAVARVYS